MITDSDALQILLAEASMPRPRVPPGFPDLRAVVNDFHTSTYVRT